METYGKLSFRLLFQPEVVDMGLQLYRWSVLDDVGGGAELIERFGANDRISSVELIR